MSKIKILFYIDSLSGGGAEKVLCTLVNNMDSGRFDITVQTLFPVDFAKFLTESVRYKYVYPKDNPFFHIVYRIEAALRIIYRRHIKDNYDIECAYLECGPTKVMASSTNKKAKKLAWAHCDFKIAFDESFVSKTTRYYKKYDKIICVSEQCKNSFDELFNKQFDTEIIHNVVDSEEIVKKSAEPLPDNIVKEKFTLCSVARFSPQKNIPRLLKTCLKLHEEGNDFELWLVGDGASREEIEKFIDEHEMQSYIRLWGFRSNPYPFIKAADVCVCSSDYEGFSTFITESLILGKPIVTTDCSGMKELLGESEYGIITENTDDAFLSGLKKMITDGALAAHYLEKAEARGKDFSVQTLVKENEACFIKTAGEVLIDD